MQCIQTIEDADNLKIAESMWAENQKQKYDLLWPYILCVCISVALVYKSQDFLSVCTCMYM